MRERFRRFQRVRERFDEGGDGFIRRRSGNGVGFVRVERQPEDGERERESQKRLPQLFRPREHQPRQKRGRQPGDGKGSFAEARPIAASRRIRLSYIADSSVCVDYRIYGV